MRNTKLLVTLEGVIIAAIAMVLSLLPIGAGNAYFDLSLGLIPLGVYMLRRGALPAMAAGLLWGLLLILIGKAWILSPLQVILDYPAAFACGGLGGIWVGRLNRLFAEDKRGAAIRTAVYAGVTSAVARWALHFIAGFVFWADATAPSGMNPYLFSFIGNGGSALANAIMLAVVLALLTRKARILLTIGKH